MRQALRLVQRNGRPRPAPRKHLATVWATLDGATDGFKREDLTNEEAPGQSQEVVVHGWFILSTRRAFLVGHPSHTGIPHRARLMTRRMMR
jgi:hypothetical protein